ATKAGPMPTHQHLWTDDRHDLQDRWKPSIQLDKEQAIAVCKPDASVDYPAHHNNLVAERSIFAFKSALRLEWRDEEGKNKTEQRDHCAPTLGDSLPQSIRIRFSVHTPTAPTNRTTPANITGTGLRKALANTGA